MKRYFSVLTFVGFFLAASGCEQNDELIENQSRSFPKRADKITAGAFLETPSKDSRALQKPRYAVSVKGISLLQEFEGKVICESATEKNFHCPYNDSADYCTIGYGHLIAKKPCEELTGALKSQGFWDGISENKAKEILRRDLRLSQIALETQLDQGDLRIGIADISASQYDALTSFIFNVGGGNFRKSTLLKKLRSREDISGSLEVVQQFRRWTKAGGVHVKGLLNRRNKEIEHFFEGFEMPKESRLSVSGDEIDILIGE